MGNYGRICVQPVACWFWINAHYVPMIPLGCIVSPHNGINSEDMCALQMLRSSFTLLDYNNCNKWNWPLDFEVILLLYSL